MNVYSVMKSCDPSLPDIEEVEGIILKNYPTPLWFLFNNELEIIASECITDEQEFLASCIQEKVCERLGEPVSH